MSSTIYIASNAPIMPRPNPHEKMVSVNEALALGIKVSDYLLTDDFDKDKPGVILVSDRDIVVDVDNGTITDGDFDDDFGIYLTEKTNGMTTDKMYSAVFEIIRCTPARAEKFIEYLKDQLKTTSEIELHHAWVDNEPERKTEMVKISIDDLTATDIQNLIDKDVFGKPCVDFGYLISST